MHAMIACAPDAEHTVLIVRHRDHLGKEERRPGTAYIDAGRLSFRRSLGIVAETYRRLMPDVVHAHSSYAGIYVRVLPGIPRSKIVYTPHCFGFERHDVGALARLGARLAEKALMPRTGTVLAVGSREAELARSLSRKVRVIEATNIPDVPPRLVGSARGPEPGEPLVVMATGRVCPQKDPAFFAAVARRIKTSHLPVTWVWVGDGDPELKLELAAAGVDVTGWRDRDTVLEMLASGHVCLHTAAWEAAVPITVLEAAEIGLPVVMRAIPATRDAPVGKLVDDVAQAAETIGTLVDSRNWLDLQELTRSTLEARAGRARLVLELDSVYGMTD
jgi:glycosyltransferase involved in cell wall biosynthesis